MQRAPVITSGVREQLQISSEEHKSRNFNGLYQMPNISKRVRKRQQRVCFAQDGFLLVFFPPFFIHTKQRGGSLPSFSCPQANLQVVLRIEMHVCTDCAKE